MSKVETHLLSIVESHKPLRIMGTYLKVDRFGELLQRQDLELKNGTAPNLCSKMLGKLEMLLQQQQIGIRFGQVTWLEGGVKEEQPFGREKEKVSFRKQKHMNKLFSILSGAKVRATVESCLPCGLDRIVSGQSAIDSQRPGQPYPTNLRPLKTNNFRLESRTTVAAPEAKSNIPTAGWVNVTKMCFLIMMNEFVAPFG